LIGSFLRDPRPEEDRREAEGRGGGMEKARGVNKGTGT
jgi:hypothetical protein